MAQNSEVLSSNPAGLDICHRGCAYAVLQTVQTKGLECAVLTMVLCTIKDPWIHSIRVGHSPGSGLPSVAILPCLCRERRNAIITHSLTTSDLEYIDYGNWTAITSHKPAPNRKYMYNCPFHNKSQQTVTSIFTQKKTCSHGGPWMIMLMKKVFVVQIKRQYMLT